MLVAIIAMAANSNNSIRVRLYFDYPPPAVSDCRMCWLLVDLNKCRVVADLESVIRDKFDLSRKNILNLFIDDCYLPHTESIHVVRDNDSVSVKVDSLVPAINGYCSDPDHQVERASSKKRRRNSNAEPFDNDVCLERKKRKRKKKEKKKMELSKGGETEETQGPERDKDLKRKETEKKTASKKPSSAKHTLVKSTVKSPGPKPVDVNGKAKAKQVSSSDSSDSSSEEANASKHTPNVQKTPIPKSTPVSPAPVKVPLKAKPTSKQPNPCPSSSSETESSSDEVPANTSTKGLPPAKPITPPASKSVSSQLTACASKQTTFVTPDPVSKAAGLPQSSDSGSSSEEEIKLVIKRPLQMPLQMQGLTAASEPAWRGRGRGSWNPRGRGVRGAAAAAAGGGGGCRGSSSEGRSGRGPGREFHFNYDEEPQRKQSSFENGLLTNHSVLLQNQAEPPPKRDYSTMPLLAAPPSVGQKIAFKLLELTENYTPEVSEYKEGRIVSFDHATKQVELQLLNAYQAPVGPGKFDLVYQNVDGSESVEYAISRGSSVTERWDSLLEPRLVI